MDDRKKLIQKQVDFCNKKGWPMFAPSNGKCYYCNNDIVTKDWATNLITYCSICNKSYVE